MDERKVIYGNGFQISSQKLETQIVIKLETPIFDEQTGKCTGANIDEVADIRMNPILAKKFSDALIHQIAEYEKNFGVIKDEADEELSGSN